jgi:Tol biopolymer transport system component
LTVNAIEVHGVSFMPVTETTNEIVAIHKVWPEGAWPCFSLEGRHLVFTGHLDRPTNRLLMLAVEGGEEPRIITPPEMHANRPTWLADSQQIAFNRDQRSIWTLDLETKRYEPFLDLPADAPRFFHPCAYPSKRAVVVVAFHENDGGRQGVLYKLTPGAVGPITQLTNPRQVCAGRPGVSPDGETVVFAGNAGRFDQGANQLWLVTSNGMARRLERGAPAICQGRSPRWSPDGEWIACTSTRPEADPRESTPKAVWIIRADGSASYRLTDRAFDPHHVAWSPNQKLLACAGGQGLGLLELPPRFQMKSAKRTEESREGQ